MKHSIEANLRSVGGTLLLAGLCLASPGCKKDTPKGQEVPPASDVSPKSEATLAPGPAAEQAAAPKPQAAAVVQALGPVPSSFDGAPKVNIESAVGIGCEANAKDGWLKLLCWKKNSTGGKPVRALFQSEADAAASKGEPVPPGAGLPVDPNAAPSTSASAAAPSTTAPSTTGSAASSASAATDADAGAAPTFAVEPGERGEITILVPWQEGRKTSVRMEWTDVVYDLTVEGTTGALKRPANLAIRKACAALTQAADGLVSGGKKSGALQQADVKDLPKFGRCQLAGTGAWSLALDSISASGADAARSVTVKVSAVHLDEAGTKVSAPFTELSFAPGGLEMPIPMIFDYDGDGSHEILVRYEVKARPQPASGPLPVPPGVLSFKNSKIESFNVGALAAGGFSVEQLDKDMRPDVADYGPFTAWLSKSCGAAKCPSRIQGPRFFYQSKADGTFDRDSDGAKAALKRACAEKPSSVVVAGAQGVNVQNTAERVACARAWKVETQEIEKQLQEAKAKLCSSGDTCEVLTTLQSWAGASAPTTL